MKFLAWLLAIIVFFSSFFVGFAYNLHQTFLTPENTKQALTKVDFYSQIKSVLKKDFFDAAASSDGSATKIINASIGQFDFQPMIENLISDFYIGLKQKNAFALNIDLTGFKNVFISNLLPTTNKESAEELATAVPDSWQVDLSGYKSSIAVVKFMYVDYIWILIVYGIAVFLFLLFCLLNSVKYLKLFFWTFLIVGLLLLLQMFFWKVVNLSPFLALIESQGNSGLVILLENIVSYFKLQTTQLLLWESIYLIALSIIGLIVVSLIPTKIVNVPLHENK